MNVNHNGLTYSFHVEPGKEVSSGQESADRGYRKFTHDIRRAFNLPMDAELNITFTCDEPSTKDDPIASEGIRDAVMPRETQCQFCGEQLPDWRAPLTPPTGATGPAIMNVNHNGLTYSFHVEPGKEVSSGQESADRGYRKFTHDIRRAFNLPMDAELNITFTCDEPSTKDDPIASEGSLLTLQGPGAYDAAVHCASISAARRALTCGSTGSDLLGQP
ncbi:zygote specific ZYS1 isoform B, partial [Haematococcus lacustris]